MLEIERKFAVILESGKTFRADETFLIEQTYYRFDHWPTTRLRSVSRKKEQGPVSVSFFETQKTGSGISRTEIEKELSFEEFAVAKLRYAASASETASIFKIRARSGRWEVDFFSKKSDGELVAVAEVELFSEDEPLPPFPETISILKEVTEDPAYGNERLAFDGLSTLILSCREQVHGY